MKKFWNIAVKHLMTAISYILPLIIGASLVIAVAKIGGLAAGVTDLSLYKDTGGFFNILYELEQIGWVGIGLMNAVYAGFLAYSIADKPGLAAGFIGGMIANNRQMGFTGALIAGTLAGILAKICKEKIVLKGSLSSLVPMVILPLITIGITGFVMVIILSGPLSQANEAMINWILYMTENSTNFAVVAMILGMMIGFDLGGPVGKAAWFAVNGLFLSGVYLPAIALNAAICIPPLGYAVATFIKKNKFSTELRDAGKGALVMGFIGITEGAIAFTLKHPLKLIPLNVIGAGIGAAVTILLGAFATIPPVGGVYGAISVGNPLAYIGGLAAGTLFIAFGSILMCDFNDEEVAKNNEDFELTFEEL